MCMACEEQAMMWRYELEMAVLRGVIPPGFEPADFEAAGLPVPGRAQPAAKPSAKPNPFVCESPDDE